MYGGSIRCPECGYDFYCETIYSSIDCPRCGTVINLQPIPELVIEAAGSVEEGV